jgi:adenylate kinase
MHSKHTGVKGHITAADTKVRMQYGLVHISVGDLLREQVAIGTAAGKRAKEFMDSGNLVPDEVVVEMVVHRLSQEDVQKAGWLLDGYPRSASQADAIVKEGINPHVFLLIQVPDEIIVERVVGRRSDPVTGEIYHLKYNPPPDDPQVQGRLVQVRFCLQRGWRIAP